MNPCYNNGKGCPERTMTCHATCTRHAKWKQEYEQEQQRILEDIKNTRERVNYQVWTIRRTV